MTIDSKFHADARGQWEPRLLPVVLESRARLQGDTVAFRFLEDGVRESVAWTYAEVVDRARRVGAALRQQAELGDRVLLIYPPGLDFVVAFCACLMSGLVAVPCPPPGARSRATGRLAAIARDAQARLLATTAALSTGLQAQAALGEAWTCLTTDQPAATTDPACGAEPQAASYKPSSQDLAFLQYTSGSTGQPKGVMVTQGQLAANLEALRLTFSLTADDVSVTWLPSFHDMGLVDGVLEPLYAGCLGVVMPPVAFLMNPRCWLQALSNYGGTHGGGPSFAYDLLLQRLNDDDWKGLDLSRWRSAYNGAEPVRFEVIERFSRQARRAGFRAEAMVPCYGMAEATLMVTCARVGRPPRILWVQSAELERNRLVIAGEQTEGARALVGCGAAEWGTDVVIADPQNLRALPEGRVGEVWVRGPAIAQGYWGQAELTEASFAAHLADGSGPFLRTGDLGALVGGELFVTGRIKDLIILQGRNHYPQDIESCAEAAHPALRSSNSAAFSVPSPDGEALVMVMEVQRSARRDLDVEAVAAAVREAVAEAHGAIVECVTLIAPGSLPKTSSGKIQRRACSQAWLRLAAESTEGGEGAATDIGLKVLGHSMRRAGHSAPQTAPSGGPSHRKPSPDLAFSSPAELELRLLDLAAQVLQVRPALLDPDQPLSRAGLDSLRAVRLASEIGQLMGRSVPPTLLYDHPTLSGLARTLMGLKGSGAAAPESPALPATDGVQLPVAIVGLGCRVPGARGAQALWQLLSKGSDAVTSMAGRRWPASTLQARGLGHLKAGLVDGLDLVDDTLFGLSAAEAQKMDPQQRMLLEVSWEALEDAQIAPARWAGRPVGVFVGISSQDWSRITAPLGGPAQLFHGTGSALSIAANRLSYFYNFQGPSVAVDTACSSSLMALHLACRALEGGECETALVGGVNALLDPSMSEAFAHAGMLSPSGRCATFDAQADGYVRGEGCVVLVLKPLARAQADGDRILAVVRGTATNQDGRSQGLTAPNGPAQQAVVRAALQRAGASAHQVAYVEAHGTGTALGDPIELQALEQVFGPGRSPAQPLWVGSVKTQVGHLEAAAGLMGVAKTALCLHHRLLTPHLHWRQPNALAPIGPDRFLRVPTAVHPWPEGSATWAGVSSFGFGGANVHAVLGPSTVAPVARETSSQDSSISEPLPLMLSAATNASLERLALAWAQRLEAADEPDGSRQWAAACAVAAHGREVLPYRMALWAEPTAARDGARRLRAWAADPFRRAQAAGRPRVAWMFTGQGSVSTGMGLPFIDDPAFSSGLAEVAPWVEPALPQPLEHLLTQAPIQDLTPTAVAQPLLFAYGWAMARWWKAQGVSPAFVMGHSLGEITAAAVGGWITLESAASFVVARGRIMAPVSGRMVAVAAPHETVMGVLAALAPSRDPIGRPVAAGWGLAADNGTQETVISGPESGLAHVREALAEAGLQATVLNTPHAFHSESLDPLLPALREAAAKLRFTKPALPLLCTGPTLDAASPDYWVAQAREPVRFRSALEAAQAQGVDVWLELGPRPVLCGLVQQQIPTATVVSAASSSNAALAALWACGAMPNDSLASRVPRLHPAQVQSLKAPSYPFEPKRHWPVGLASCEPDLHPSDTAPGSGSGRAPLVRVAYRALYADEVKAAPVEPGTGCVLIGRPGAQRASWAAALQELGVNVRGVDLSPVEGSGALPQALSDLAADPGGSRISVVVLLESDAVQAKVGPQRMAGLMAAVRQAYAQVLAAAQGLLQHRDRSPLDVLRLHAVAEGVSEPVAQAAAAVLRVLALEHPSAAGHFFNATPAGGAVKEMAARCVARGSPVRQEWRVNAQGWAVRDERIVPREGAHAATFGSETAHEAPAPDAISAHDWRGAGVLVAGGLGGVGRHLVQAFAQRGAACVWVVGRRLPEAAELQAWRAQMASLGVTLEAWSVDLEDSAQRQSLCEQLRRSKTPLTDVVYAAGRTADAPLPQQTLVAFDTISRIQMEAAMALRYALDDLPWQRFIVAGSAAGLAGSVAQAPYAAVHAALAAWAQQEDEACSAQGASRAHGARRAAGRRVLTLAWGPWRDTGLAASATVKQSLAVQGISLLEPQDACEGLFDLVDHGWSHGGLFHPRSTASPLRASPAQGSLEAQAHDSASARDRWQQARPNERRDCAVALLLEDALATLGHPPGHPLDLHRGFFEVGFDSLSLVALRQRVQTRWGLSLPTTVAFEHPCLGDLAQHLHETLRAESTGVSTAPPHEAQRVNAATASNPSPQAPSGIADDALARELAAIEKLLG